MKTPPYHPFRSQKAKERYLALYDERARSWPVAGETRTVETSHGQTFVRICGPSTAPPLVLLPATSSTSLFWTPNIKTLAEHFCVYAVDNIYDFGRSVFAAPMKTPDDMVDWLHALFTQLGLGDRVHLMGLSYGAWLISQYALRYPDGVNKIVMIAPPATVIQFPLAWAWYGLTTLIPHRYFLENTMRWMFPVLSRKDDEESRRLRGELLEDGFVGLRCFKLKMPPAPTVLTAEQWRRIPAPALFMVGEHEVLYPAREAVEHLAEVAPHVQTAIVPDAGHDITIVQAELVGKTALAFLLG